jgi:hypothetical protein
MRSGRWRLQTLALLVAVAPRGEPAAAMTAQAPGRSSSERQRYQAA